MSSIHVTVSREQAEIVRRMVGEGATLVAIGRACGRSYEWACRAVRKLGLQRCKWRIIEWTPEMNTFILDARTQKRSWDFIAEHFGISRSAVRHHADTLRSAAVAQSAPVDVLSGSQRGDQALPAGHPLTWSAISDALSGGASFHV